MKQCSNINKRISQWLILLFLLTITISSYSQHNQVANSSFEDSVACPSAADSDFLPHPWHRPTIAMYQSGFYLNSCTTDPLVGVPQNGVGYQYAHTGQAYAYIRCYTLNVNTNRDYLQTKLKDSLILGSKYFVEFYANAADLLGYSSNNISMLFTKKAIYPDTLTDPEGVIVGNAQIYNYGNPIIMDTMNWVKVSGIFKAQGGEQYITIGNFKYGNQTNTKLINTINPKCDCAGYYIDDVSVIPLDIMPLKADAGRDTTIHIGDSAFIGSLTNGIDSIKWQVLNTNGTIDSIRPGFWVHPQQNTCYVLTQTVNGFTSSDTVCVNVQTVPLKFLKYEVRSTNEKLVENLWTTANEINVSHFGIQRSLNGKDFETIGKLNAKGFSYNEYNYVDIQPLNGDNYYRIESIDRDGKRSYSEVLFMNVNKKNGINIYPNPSRDIVKVESIEQIKEVKIIDYLGRTIYQSIASFQQSSVNTKQFTKGLYVVKILLTNGEVKNERLLVE